jgi:3-isopropylmalate/(R)-2-methylmalate dehydratase large subunit
VTSPQAFSGLRERGLKVRRPDLTLSPPTDHSIPTTDRSLPIVDPIAANQVKQFEQNCAEFGIPATAHSPNIRASCTSSDRSRVCTQPGMTVVCGDSHTATHGAFGALAFGIGTSEVEHVLATQCLLQRPSKTFRVRVDGTLRPALARRTSFSNLIARIGIGGGTGCVFRIHRLRHSRSRYGRAHDRLQHVDRRRRARRPDRAGRHDFQYLARPPVRAEGRGLG